MAEKRLSAKELRALPEADLREQAAKLRQELWQQRVKMKEGSIQQTHQGRAVRRQIARVLTIARQQQAKPERTSPS